MKKLLFVAILTLAQHYVFAQPDVSVRLSQVSYSSVDPDGAGLATGSVVIRFELMSTGGTVDADGFGIGAAFQSANLMPASPANITALGPLAPLGWTISPNLAGNDIPMASQSIGGRIYDKRFIIGFSQGATGTTMPITSSWQPIFEVTYWTKGLVAPQGGYTVIEPGSLVPGHSISADGGLSEYPLLSPAFPAGTPLGGSLVPVLFSKFEANCSPNGTLISWKTAQESNSSYFEVQRSTDGSTWTNMGRTPAAGNSSVERSYNQIDLAAGNAMYRIKQVDKDGQFIYTEVKTANCQVKNITTLVYPVPAQTELNVVIRSDKALKTQLIIFDAVGKAVKRIDVNVLNGTNNFKISLNGLSSGEYLLKSTNSDLDLRKQFTIIR